MENKQKKLFILRKAEKNAVSTLRERDEHLSAFAYIALSLSMIFVAMLCISLGSVHLSFANIISAIGSYLFPHLEADSMSQSIILSVRLPRVLCVALVGASLSLCGASMQGLLRNPLAESSTLGVSSGASLGAVVAIAFSIQIPGFFLEATMLMAIVFAFASLFFILSLAHRLDYSMSTHTIILVGIIFSMFCTSLISLVTAFSGDKLRSVTFWTMGSLSGSNYTNALTLLVTLLVCGTVLLRYARELNAFAIGEDNARHIGIDVKKVKLITLIAVSILIGVCVSIGGSIGFVGLVIPHITRMITGPNHKRLLPASLFSGAIFLLLADLISRVLISPLELPVGVVTSIIGSIAFVYIFYSNRKVR